MKKIKLSIHGGGRLEIHGTHTDGPLVVLLSRDNFFVDERLVARVIRFLTEKNIAVARYESRFQETGRLIDRRCFRPLPLRIRQALKVLQLLFFPARWRHFSARHRAEANSIPYRSQSLRELAAFLGPGRELVFLARSGGGRVASLVADEVAAGKLVCLGYPFKHPEEPPDPGRYAHLEKLRTPFLIIQGTRDPYGGREIAQLYRFARSTSIRWVETDHSFAVADEEWAHILGMIHEFIRQPDAEQGRK
jgi:hypothetical protein